MRKLVDLRIFLRFYFVMCWTHMGQIMSNEMPLQLHLTIFNKIV